MMKELMKALFKSDGPAHPGKLKDPEFKRRDKAVEAAGNKHDKNPTPENHSKLVAAIAHREAHIEATPSTKEHINKLNAHMNHKWGGDRPMRKSEEIEPLRKTPAPFIAADEGSFKKGPVSDLLTDQRSKNPRVAQLPNGMRMETHEVPSASGTPGMEHHNHFLFHPDHKDPVAGISTWPLGSGDIDTGDGVHSSERGDHQVSTAKIDPQHAGNGYGKQLYSAILRYHVSPGNKLWSDKQVSPDAMNAWRSFKGKQGVSGFLGRYPKNPADPKFQEGTDAHEDLRQHPNFVSLDHKKFNEQEHFPSAKKLRKSDPMGIASALAKMEPLMKPYSSEAQRRWAHTAAGEKALGGPSHVHEWDEATKGKKLPEKLSKGTKMMMDWFKNPRTPEQRKQKHDVKHPEQPAEHKQVTRRNYREKVVHIPTGKEVYKSQK